MSYILKTSDGQYIGINGIVVPSQLDAMRVPDDVRLVHLRARTHYVYYPGLGWSAEPDASPAPLSPDSRYDDTSF